MKSVIITGSSKGIGLGMALEFLKNNCSVLISSRKQADVDAAVKDFSAQFGAEKVMGLTCDVTDISTGAGSLGCRSRKIRQSRYLDQ